MKQKEKERDLVPILQQNEHLAELLSKAEEEITENEKKTKHYSVKKGPDVGVHVCQF